MNGIIVPSRLGGPGRAVAIVLGLAALAIPGCSDSSPPSSAVVGTKPGESLAPGGPIKPNVTPSKGAAKAEPF